MFVSITQTVRESEIQSTEGGRGELDRGGRQVWGAGGGGDMELQEE